MPDTEMVKKIADFFRVSVDYLLERSMERSTIDEMKVSMASDPELAQVWDELSSREDLQELIKATKDMPSEKVEQIIRIIKAM